MKHIQAYKTGWTVWKEWLLKGQQNQMKPRLRKTMGKMERVEFGRGFTAHTMKRRRKITTCDTHRWWLPFYYPSCSSPKCIPALGLNRDGTWTAWHLVPDQHPQAVERCLSGAGGTENILHLWHPHIHTKYINSKHREKRTIKMAWILSASWKCGTELKPGHKRLIAIH